MVEHNVYHPSTDQDDQDRKLILEKAAEFDPELLPKPGFTFWYLIFLLTLIAFANIAI